MTHANSHRGSHARTARQRDATPPPRRAPAHPRRVDPATFAASPSLEQFHALLRTMERLRKDLLHRAQINVERVKALKGVPTDDGRIRGRNGVAGDLPDGRARTST